MDPSAIQANPLLQSFLELFGRLHPLAIHFPIALLLVGALVEFLRVRGDDRRPSATVLTCLGFGALGAIAAAGSGWVWEAQEPLGSSVARTVFLHRWLGVGAAGVATLGAVLALAARWSGGPALATAYRACLLLAALGVSAGGYLGGELVWGEGHLTSVFEVEQEKPAAPRPDEAPPEAEPVAAPTAESIPDPIPESGPALASTAAAPLTPDTQLTFASHVEPILASHCYECHGPRKRKAGLRLDGYERLFEDDPEFWVVIPGDLEASFLYQRITLPPDHEDFMPAKGDPLTAEEVAVLRAWIEAGAKETEVFHLGDVELAPAAEAGSEENGPSSQEPHR